MRRCDDAVSGMAIPVAVMVGAFAAIALTTGEIALPFGQEGVARLLGGEAGTWRTVTPR